MFLAEILRLSDLEAFAQRVCLVFAKHLGHISAPDFYRKACVRI